MNRKLIKYLPVFLQSYAEIEQIMEAEQEQIESLWRSRKELLKEAFVSDESEIGAKRWECILGIIPFDTDTLQLRNLRIQSRIIDDLPYTYKTLQNQLKTLCGENGYEIILDGDTFTLYVKVALETKKLRNVIEKLCEGVVPLNLDIQVLLMYNTHELLQPYIHTNLNDYSYSQLREEPLI